MTTQAAIFLTIFLGCLLEGEVVIVAFAVLAASPRFPLDPFTVGLAATLGTVAGDQAVYWMGRLAKHPNRVTLRGRRLLSDERRDRLERYFLRHGAASVFLLRYAFGLRTIGYFFAGAMRMPWRRFTVADLLGSASWVAIQVALGWLVGRPLLLILREHEVVLLVVPLTVLLIWWVVRRHRTTDRAALPRG